MDITFNSLFEMAFSEPDKALILAQYLPSKELAKKKLLTLKDSGNHNQKYWIERLLISRYPTFDILRAISDSQNYLSRIRAQKMLLEIFSKQLSEDILKDLIRNGDGEISRKAKSIYIKRFG